MSDAVTYYALFDEGGAPQGFFASDVVPTPPEGATKILPEQWLEFIAHPGRRRWEGGATAHAGAAR